ncbi:MAG: biotin synthase BioB [Planctomycetaceae bacterium]|jgi:biotin synthase|nr:biotin synthase BioB [Planctomycetaceae bacterium]
MQFTLTDIEHAPLEELLHESERVRTATFGNKIDLCAIVNIKSGRCAMNCRFCAQSVHYSTQTPIYPLRSTEELGEATRTLWKQGIFRVGWVASGCGPTKEELNTIIESAEQVLSNSPAGLAGSLCCASLGQLDSDSLARLKKAGFRRYHHNLETSEQFYPQICTTQHWRDRFATLERAKGLDWKVCSGGLFGLGETWNDRFQLALTLRTLQVDSIPLNFYNAVSGTPFANREPLNLEEALRIIVLFRLTLPNAAIRICGGRPKIFAEYSHMLFRAGADALMTGNYLTTTGISPEQDRKIIHENGLQTIN